MSATLSSESQKGPEVTESPISPDEHPEAPEPIQIRNGNLMTGSMTGSKRAITTVRSSRSVPIQRIAALTRRSGSHQSPVNPLIRISDRRAGGAGRSECSARSAFREELRQRRYVRTRAGKPLRKGVGGSVVAADVGEVCPGPMSEQPNEILMTGSFLMMSYVGNLPGRNTMSEQQPLTRSHVESASEIATAIRAIPPPTTHAHATQLLMYTRRHRRT